MEKKKKNWNELEARVVSHKHYLGPELTYSVTTETSPSKVWKKFIRQNL